MMPHKYGKYLLGVDYWQKNFADYVQGGFGGVL